MGKEPIMSTEDMQTDELETTLTTEDELPEKYKGKSPLEIANMHMAAEREKSRIANDLGQMRQVADELLGLQRERSDKTRAVERKPITTDDLVSDPNEALERAVSDNPEVVRTREEVSSLRRDLQRTRFEKDYPDFQEDLGNPEFADWIKTNKVRTALGGAANKGDYEAASSLWSLWEERKSDLTEASKAKKEKRKQQEKAGALEGGSGQGGDTEKVYSRFEMMNLHRKVLSGDREAQAKWNDPNFQNMRTKAYADKRVK